jgi:tRNA 2-thiouridine synthesizing protein A
MECYRLEKPRASRMLKFIMMNADRELDVRGLNCPLPILRAKKVLGDLSAGQVLKVMATDPGSVKDFQAFCKQTGNELLSHSEGPEFTFFMKKR